MTNVSIPRVVFRAFPALVAAVLLCTLAVPSARANVLVYEGFHPSDYGITTGTGTKSANIGSTTGNYTTNVATGAWYSGIWKPKKGNTNETSTRICCD